MDKFLAALENIMVAITFAEHSIMPQTRREQEETNLACAPKSAA